jgi:hypothetical protein
MDILPFDGLGKGHAFGIFVPDRTSESLVPTRMKMLKATLLKSDPLVSLDVGARSPLA